MAKRKGEIAPALIAADLQPTGVAGRFCAAFDTIGTKLAIDAGGSVKDPPGSAVEQPVLILYPSAMQNLEQVASSVAPSVYTFNQPAPA